jgi:tetratricopeptide (TPR) repeat protein
MRGLPASRRCAGSACPLAGGPPMTAKKWTDDDTRWLKANFGRMDLQSIAYKLGFPLEEVGKRVRLLRLATPEPVAPGKKGPGSLKEAQREISAARREYEKAIDLFHKRHFEEAARRFEDFVEKHPDEKEFVDRARMYLTACRNGKKGRVAAPSEPEDLYHVAVFEKNRGNAAKALELLKKSAGKRDGDGRLHYLAACCHSLLGDVEQALANLKKAIAADDRNRIQARLDADFAPLRGQQAFAELLAGGA